MTPLASIALSGMTAATSRLGASAHNLANLGTAGFRRQIASTEPLPGGGAAPRLDRAAEPGPSLETDVVGLLSAKHAFLANLAVFRTSDEMTGALLDTVA